MYLHSPFEESVLVEVSRIMYVFNEYTEYLVYLVALLDPYVVLAVNGQPIDGIEEWMLLPGKQLTEL